ncbi:MULTISPECIES: vitamin K epoxide reductase family protein [unclassified Pseudonocardia]|uniref:vitamin K epoxide reductase family protein n=1 Tax=unclassified Pseudonocardia TaxID=2619320 RepID=UPI000963470C|nr:MULTISPECIES: vitamin K epoxide reductase family protein [unclassified Pseudonocardia]OLL77051.1 Vitamin K epoxide reductase [Pseudonocardia sp. Ae150A_Ps1]OLL88838.1 Vitamin K epoxide reductase [Pseudonocardia sp. Ae263_Ps1]OLL91136.1 Vitamin K epoxide reductase [Pseudonocardia sp. Ae356_Ps1]
MTAAAMTEEIDRVPGGPVAGGVPGPVPRVLPWLLTLGGALGLVAAFTLTVERIELLLDPGYTPSCSINPVLSCGSVMQTEQAAFFGFPNPLLGIGAFAVVVTVGAALLAGVRFPAWWWAGLTAGAALGVAFVHYLIVQSLYEIGALCPYCMVVWAVTIPIFWYSALAALDRSGAARGLYEGLRRYHAVPVVLWFLVIIGLALQRFWIYWSSLL